VTLIQVQLNHGEFKTEKNQDRQPWRLRHHHTRPTLVPPCFSLQH